MNEKKNNFLSASQLLLIKRREFNPKEQKVEAADSTLASKVRLSKETKGAAQPTYAQSKL